MKIRIESKQGGDWMEAESVGEHDMLGSLTDLTNGTDILLFGWHEGTPGVWRAVGGTAHEVGALRAIETFDLEPISDLTTPYEVPVIHPTLGLMRVRWTLVKDNA
jgi:hypothetical protein